MCQPFEMCVQLSVLFILDEERNTAAAFRLSLVVKTGGSQRRREVTVIGTNNYFNHLNFWGIL